MALFYYHLFTYSDGWNEIHRLMGSNTFKIGSELDLDAVIELYRDSTFGERRPVDDRAPIQDMLRNANLFPASVATPPGGKDCCNNMK